MVVDVLVDELLEQDVDEVLDQTNMPEDVLEALELHALLSSM